MWVLAGHSPPLAQARMVVESPPARVARAFTFATETLQLLLESQKVRVFAWSDQVPPFSATASTTLLPVEIFAISVP
jgi:hypothetical protein